MNFKKYWAFKLVGILIVIYILQVIFPIITDLFLLKSTDIFSRPWILITSIFLHGGLSHLLLNGFALVLFGSILEGTIGTKKFLTIYFIGGIIASLVFVIGLPILSSIGMPSSGNALGASGAIFAVLGALTVLRPTMTVWVSFMPMPMWVAAIFWAGQDLLGIFIADNVANFAHLGGLVFGLIIGFYYRGRSVRDHKPRVSKSIMLSDEEIEQWEDRNFNFK